MPCPRPWRQSACRLTGKTARSPVRPRRASPKGFGKTRSCAFGPMVFNLRRGDSRIIIVHFSTPMPGAALPPWGELALLFTTAREATSPRTADFICSPQTGTERGAQMTWDGAPTSSSCNWQEQRRPRLLPMIQIASREPLERFYRRIVLEFGTIPMGPRLKSRFRLRQVALQVLDNP